LFYFGLSKEEDKNKLADEQITKKLQNNPTNCNDMGKLGYTLNGFYIVNGGDNIERFGVVLCQFKLPLGEAYENKCK